MKKTLNVKIGGVAFTIDEDAYLMLKRYLDDVGSRCESSVAGETVNDIEMRMADIFTENISAPNQTVGIDLVKRATGIIGSADNFGESRNPNGDSTGRKRLTRSRNERVLAGICGGLAEHFSIDLTLVRLVTFLLIFFGGISLWVYIILWIIIPEER